MCLPAKMCSAHVGRSPTICGLFLSTLNWHYCSYISKPSEPAFATDFPHNALPEAGSDVISGVAVEYKLGVNVLVEFGDCRSNRARDILAAPFVMAADDDRPWPTDLNKQKAISNGWARRNAPPLIFLKSHFSSTLVINPDTKVICT